MEAIRGRGRVIVINETHRLAPWADVLYAADAMYWRSSPTAMQFAGERWASDADGPLDPSIRRVRVVAGRGLSRRREHLHSGGHSGYQAINFAFLRGAARIVLLGYDMQCSGGRRHWHPDHPAPLKNTSNFAGRIRAMQQLAADLAAAGVECINCTRDTALPWFQRSTLERVL